MKALVLVWCQHHLALSGRKRNGNSCELGEIIVFFILPRTPQCDPSRHLKGFGMFLGILHRAPQKNHGGPKHIIKKSTHVLGNSSVVGGVHQGVHSMCLFGEYGLECNTILIPQNGQTKETTKKKWFPRHWGLLWILDRLWKIIVS